MYLIRNNMNIGTLHKSDTGFTVKFYSTFTDRVESYPLHEDSLEQAMSSTGNGTQIVFEVADEKAKLVSNEKAANLYFNLGS